MKNDDVWLVVPLYNEGTVIGDVVRSARQTFPHIVCVDDGSSDESAVEAEAAGAVVIRHPVNLGQGAALQTGFDYALAQPRMRYVVTFDADGQHQVGDVLQMLTLARRDALDVVFGSRFLDDRTKPSVLKKVVLRAAVGYTNLTTRTRLTDAHNGLRVISRDVVARLDITQNRMAHASEIVAQIGAMNVSVRREPGPHPLHRLLTGQGPVPVERGQHPGRADMTGTCWRRSSTRRCSCPGRARASALRALSAKVERGAVVAANPWDGASYLYLVSGRRMLFPTEKALNSPDRVLMAKYLDDVGRSPQVCAAARRQHVRYAITGGTPYGTGTGYTHFGGVDRVGHSSAFRKVAVAEPFRLYQLVRCARG